MADCPLTAAELAVVQLLADGLSYKEIAHRQGRSVSTVRSHVHSVCRKLRVNRSAQAVLRCAREGWVVSEPAQSAARHLSRLADATEALVGAVERRNGVSLAQRDYLAAFEEMLHARTEEEKIVARFHMDEALGPVLGPTAVRPNGRVKRDLVELLANAIGKTRATDHRRVRPSSGWAAHELGKDAVEASRGCAEAAPTPIAPTELRRERAA